MDRGPPSIVDYNHLIKNLHVPVASLNRIRCWPNHKNIQNNLQFDLDLKIDLNNIWLIAAYLSNNESWESFALNKDINKLVCEACSEGAQKADEEQIDAFIKSHPKWEIKTESDTTFLTRTFNFSDFAEAADFAAQVGDVAERYNHHPRITIEYGKTKVDWWSHKIGNIHALDLSLAENTEQLNRG